MSPNGSVTLFLALSLLFALAPGCSTCPSTNLISKPTPNLKPNRNPYKDTCPRDALKLGVCTNLLNGLIGGEVGELPKKPCCTVFQGLIDFEAAVCLCTAIKANILGAEIDIPISLSLLLNACEKNVPSEFQCA